MNRAVTKTLTHIPCLTKGETDDYHSQHGKTCSQSIIGELHLVVLIKL